MESELDLSSLAVKFIRGNQSLFFINLSDSDKCQVIFHLSKTQNKQKMLETLFLHTKN